ncbi:hypothetical protein HID58_033359, partial [Brassica napus]
YAYVLHTAFHVTKNDGARPSCKPKPSSTYNVSPSPSSSLFRIASCIFGHYKALKEPETDRQKQLRTLRTRIRRFGKHVSLLNTHAPLMEMIQMIFGRIFKLKEALASRDILHDMYVTNNLNYTCLLLILIMAASSSYFYMFFLVMFTLYLVSTV